MENKVLRIALAPMLAALLFGWCGASMADTAHLYRCPDSEGNIQYHSKAVEGSACTRISYPPSVRWKTVTTDSNGGTSSIDTQTIARDGDIVTAWVRYDLGEAYMAVNGSRVEYTLQRERHDCRKMIASTLSYVNYGVGGAILESNTYVGNGFPSPIVPDSKGELINIAICK